MIIINYTSGNEFFTINGSKYPRIYQAVENGSESIAIYNIHDIKNKLLGTTHFSDFSINGNTYASQDEVIDELLPILYEKGSTTSGDTDLSGVYDALEGKEDKFSKNSAFNKNFGKSSGTVAEGNDARFSKAETAYGWGNHANYGYITSVDWTETLNTPTTLSGYGITDAYTISNIDDIFAGNIPQTGYNKSNWDAAFNWGNHALVGYLTEIQVADTNTNSIKHEIAEVEGTILSESVTQLNTPTLNGNTLTISFQNENNVAQTVSIDLSSLNLTETGITNATYDAAQNVITLEEQDGDVWTINLSEFSIISNTDAQGITTIEQESTVKLIVSKVGQTGLFSDLLNKPTTLSGYGITDAFSKTESDDRYLQSFTEVDTLQTVTNRGSLTTNNITIGESIFSNLLSSTNKKMISGASRTVYVGNSSLNSLELQAPAILANGNQIWHAGNLRSNSQNDARYLQSLPSHQHDAGDITSGVLSYDRLPFNVGTVADWNEAYSWGDHAGLYDNYQSWNLKTNDIQRTTVQSGGDLNLKAGTNMSLSYGAGGAVTFNVVNLPSGYSGWKLKTNDIERSTIGSNESFNVSAGNNITLALDADLKGFTINADVPDAYDGWIVRANSDSPTLISDRETLTFAGTGVSRDNETLNFKDTHVDDADWVGDTLWLRKTEGANSVPLDFSGRFVETETDPTVPQHVKDITQSDITTWNQIDNIEQDNKVRVIEITEESLPEAYTKTDIVSYLNTQGFTISDKEILSVKVVETDGNDGGSGGGYDSDYQAVLDYATANSIPLPSQAQQDIDNQVMIDYKASGGWAKDGLFFKFKGTADPAFKLINWKTLGQATAYGSLTWSNDGVKANGTNAYIVADVNYDSIANWSTTSANVSVVFFYVNNNVGDFDVLMSDQSTGDYYNLISTTRGYGTIASEGTNQPFSTHDRTLGLTSWNKTGAGAVNRIIGTTTETGSAVDMSPVAQPAVLFGRWTGSSANAFSDDGVSYWAMGGNKTAEHSAIKTVLEG